LPYLRRHPGRHRLRSDRVGADRLRRFRDRGLLLSAPDQDHVV
jgi:hypothetical protein